MAVWDQGQPVKRKARTVANRRGRPATVRCWSNEDDELCLFRTTRRTKAGAEASLPRVPLHLHHVFFYARAPTAETTGQRPPMAALRSLGAAA